MPSDYEAIRKDNRVKYGTDIGRTGRMLLSDRYGDRTHFIYEILQNAEDALAKRGESNGLRDISFSLLPDALEVSHFGKPFDEADVRGICGIALSTKNLTSIGRFGIGFKSVYSFTRSPEIHSGREHFAIDSYVWPKAIRERDLKPEETLIRLPFSVGAPTAIRDIQAGLQRLDSQTLLFLRQIESISWSISGGPSGTYVRSNEALDDETRKVTIIGEEKESDDKEQWEEHWIVFSRPVYSEGIAVGHVEIAFFMEAGEHGKNLSVQRVRDSRLVVFFPTILPTNLGFLVQGPYQTTPSRDNVPEDNEWNQNLIQETSFLLVDALQKLRKLNLLTVTTLQSLPLDGTRFPQGSRFAPFFSAVREALKTNPLLPRYGGGHTTAEGTKLARTQELRDLISPQQLAALFDSHDDINWLSDEITADRTPNLRRYLMEELDIAEVTPEVLISRLTESFLEAQPDEWIEQLYVFLRGQPALARRLREKPLVRLENGSHTVAFIGNQPKAFLPGSKRTNFPTVRRSVCQSEEAWAFLESLGLNLPDLVDDVIANVLPRYYGERVNVSESDYRSDIESVLAALDTDSHTKRDRLVSKLQDTHFIRAVDLGDDSHCFVKPKCVYQATQRLQQLFRGVPGVLIVDSSKNYLRGDRVRKMMEAVGVPQYLVQSQVEPSLTREEKCDLRRKAGHGYTYEIAVHDHTLRGLDPLLATAKGLAKDEAIERAGILWEALCDVQDRRGAGAFQGRYRWMRFTERVATFDAAFVRLLNETAWVPDKDGTMQRPSAVMFENTGWEANPFLLTKIRFKPAHIVELARAAKIDPEILNLISAHQLTADDLRKLLPKASPVSESPSPASSSRIGPGTTQPGSPAAQLGEGREIGAGRTRQDNSVTSLRTTDVKRTGESRQFISYVAIHPDQEEGADPDGLSQQARMNLEEEAIKLICSVEPELERTPPNNPGFDLVEHNDTDEAVKWVEVKAMKEDLYQRPAGISRTQFEYARQHGEGYWLYIVEFAGIPEKARILRIQNPAGKAQTFTFDRGWVSVANDVK